MAGHVSGVGISASDAIDLETRFRRLYAVHLPALLAYALRRVEDPEDAADVVAETFLVAWRKCAEVPTGPEARVWLYGVARRVLANHRRGEGRRSRLGDLLRTELADRTAVADPADEVVGVRTLRAALEQLDRTDREVLEFTAWEQLAPREIAVMLDLSPEVVRTRLSRARIRLREKLDGHDPARGGHLHSVREVPVPEEDQ